MKIEHNDATQQATITLEKGEVDVLFNILEQAKAILEAKVTHKSFKNEQTEFFINEFFRKYQA